MLHRALRSFGSIPLALTLTNHPTFGPALQRLGFISPLFKGPDVWNRAMHRLTTRAMMYVKDGDQQEHASWTLTMADVDLNLAR